MNSNDTYVYINSAEELERMKQNPVYILYFSSEDCNVCHSVFPKLLELSIDGKETIFRELSSDLRYEPDKKTRILRRNYLP